MKIILSLLLLLFLYELTDFFKIKLLLIKLLLLLGSVHLSMPGHDYVKSGRLAVTDKTKPLLYL